MGFNVKPTEPRQFAGIPIHLDEPAATGASPIVATPIHIHVHGPIAPDVHIHMEPELPESAPITEAEQGGSTEPPPAETPATEETTKTPPPV